jgi:hypothetical protein
VNDRQEDAAMFGKSIFQSVLDRLDAEESKESARDMPRTGIRGLNAGLAFDTERAAGGETVRQAYAETAGARILEPEPEPEPQPVPDPEQGPQTAAKAERPAHLDRLSVADVLNDLGLGDGETPATLAEKRRNFAALNHPDRYPIEDRTAATTRMTIANMLVDDALGRLKNPYRRQRAPKHG